MMGHVLAVIDLQLGRGPICLHEIEFAGILKKCVPKM